MSHAKAGGDGAEKKPLIEYPTRYEFKVMGLREPGFPDLVRALFAQVLGAEVPPEAITEAVSKQGKYVSLRVSVTLISEDHRTGIYQALHQDKRIVYYL